MEASVREALILPTLLSFVAEERYLAVVIFKLERLWPIYSSLLRK